MVELLTCRRLTKQVGGDTASVREVMADTNLPERAHSQTIGPVVEARLDGAGSVLPEAGGAVPQRPAPQYLTYFRSTKFGWSISSSAPNPARTPSLCA